MNLDNMCFYNASSHHALLNMHVEKTHLRMHMETFHILYIYIVYDLNHKSGSLQYIFSNVPFVKKYLRIHIDRVHESNCKKT